MDASPTRFCAQPTVSIRDWVRVFSNGPIALAWKSNSPESACAWECEKLFPVDYDDMTIELVYRVDFLVEEAVIVEVKSVERILPVHEAQLLSYLRLSNHRVGLLVNFNVARLREGIRRRVL